MQGHLRFINVHLIVKGEAVSAQAKQENGKVEVYLHSFLTLALDGGG